MEKISSLAEINSFYLQMNDGGLNRYDADEQALVFSFDSNGGELEGKTLFIKFNFVELFQLPISLSVCVGGHSLDRLEVIPDQELKRVLPDEAEVDVNYSDTDYRGFRFCGGDIRSNYYVYCLSVEAWLE